MCRSPLQMMAASRAAVKLSGHWQVHLKQSVFIQCMCTPTCNLASLLLHLPLPLQRWWCQSDHLALRMHSHMHTGLMAPLFCTMLYLDSCDAVRIHTRVMTANQCPHIEHVNSHMQENGSDAFDEQEHSQVSHHVVLLDRPGSICHESASNELWNHNQFSNHSGSIAEPCKKLS